MISVECVPAVGRRLVMDLICDGEVWRQIHISIFGKKPSIPRVCSTLDELAAAFAALEYNMARQYVMRRLSAMNLPSKTIIRSLKQRFVSDETISRVIENFTELGYLNDATWTTGFVRQQTERKLGPRAIAQKLTNKGFGREEIEEAMEPLKGSSGEEVQMDAIVALLNSKYKKKNLGDFKEKQKVVASLARRGYDFSLILKALKIDNEL